MLPYLVTSGCEDLNASSKDELVEHRVKHFVLKRAVVHELGLVFLDLRCSSRFYFSVDYGRGSKEKGHQSTLGAIGMVPRYLCSTVDGV